jgi:hypothetical protein
MARHTQVLVIGDFAEYPERNQIAYEIGKFIAGQKWVLITGGRGGVMTAASQGAHEAGGIAVAILPSASMEDANPYASIVIPSGIGFARNYTNVLAADAVVAIGGGTGTLSELAYAWHEGKPIIACGTSGGWAQELAGRTLDYRRDDAIINAASIEEVKTHLLEILGG